MKIIQLFLLLISLVSSAPIPSSLVKRRLKINWKLIFGEKTPPAASLDPTSVISASENGLQPLKQSNIHVSSQYMQQGTRNLGSEHFLEAKQGGKGIDDSPGALPVKQPKRPSAKDAKSDQASAKGEQRSAKSAVQLRDDIFTEFRLKFEALGITDIKSWDDIFKNDIAGWPSELTSIHPSGSVKLLNPDDLTESQLKLLQLDVKSITVQPYKHSPGFSNLDLKESVINDLATKVESLGGARPKKWDDIQNQDIYGWPSELTVTLPNGQLRPLNPAYMDELQLKNLESSLPKISFSPPEFGNPSPAKLRDLDDLGNTLLEKFYKSNNIPHHTGDNWDFILTQQIDGWPIELTKISKDGVTPINPKLYSDEIIDYLGDISDDIVIRLPDEAPPGNGAKSVQPSIKVTKSQLQDEIFTDLKVKLESVGVTGIKSWDDIFQNEIAGWPSELTSIHPSGSVKLLNPDDLTESQLLKIHDDLEYISVKPLESSPVLSDVDLQILKGIEDDLATKFESLTGVRPKKWEDIYDQDIYGWPGELTVTLPNGQLRPLDPSYMNSKQLKNLEINLDGVSFSLPEFGKPSPAKLRDLDDLGNTLLEKFYKSNNIPHHTGDNWDFILTQQIDGWPIDLTKISKDGVTPINPKLYSDVLIDEFAYYIDDIVIRLPDEVPAGNTAFRSVNEIKVAFSREDALDEFYKDFAKKTLPIIRKNSVPSESDQLLNYGVKNWPKELYKDGKLIPPEDMTDSQLETLIQNKDQITYY